MEQKERFKVAVLALCADQGMSLGETLMLVKQANQALAEKTADIGSATGHAATGVLNLLKIPLSWAGWGAVLGPALLGGVGGWGLARATTGINDRTSKEVKHQEMIDELRRQSASAQAQTSIAQRKKERASRRGRRLL